MDDPFEFEPPWYETICFVVGLKQIEDGKFDIASLFLFQAINGKLLQGLAEIQEDQDIVWFTLLDFFCFNGKNFPDVDDFAMVLHLACSEIKSAGVENVMVIARVTKGAIVMKKSSPGLLPDFALKRFGLAEPSSSQERLEKTVLT